MCKHCHVFKTWAAPIDQVDSPLCERMPDPSNFHSLCGRPARWRVFVLRAEHHLCTMHLAIERRRWEDLKSNLGTFGRQQSVDFVPIDEPTACDHVDEEDLNVLCGRSATHVKMVTEVWHRCDEHAASVGFRRT